MLACLAATKPWLARTRMPPPMSQGAGLTRLTPRDEPKPKSVSIAPTERTASAAERAEFEQRMAADQKRQAEEAKINKRRRKDAEQETAMLQNALLDVSEGRSPYVNGGDNLGTITTRALGGNSDDEREYEKVINLRDDPVGQMHKRGQLRDNGAKDTEEQRTKADTRLKAARRWQALFEQAVIGGAHGIDPGKDVVDGGSFSMPDTDRTTAAQALLDRLRDRLGMIAFESIHMRILGSRLVSWVLADKKTLKEVAGILGGELRLLGLGGHFRACLDKIAVELCIAADPKGRRGPQRDRDKHDVLADKRFLRPFNS